MYMTTVDPTTSYAVGCRVGTAGLSGLVILDYGQPDVHDARGNINMKGTVEGSALSENLVFASTAQIAASVEKYLSGYYNCVHSTSKSLHVGVGTNNLPLKGYRSVTATHAKAWAQMINDLDHYLITSGYARQEYVGGAFDAEPGWGNLADTRGWIDAYASQTHLPLYNFGSADGCPDHPNDPIRPAPPATCNNGWTLEDLWYVSFGNPSARNPLPQIYLNLAAYEWYNLERYAVATHGEALPLGIMTQVFACQQHPADQTCKSTDLPACQAYAMMTKLLNGSHETARPIAFVTDIGYER